MESPTTTIIFDFGNVFVTWDARNLYKRFFPTLEAVDSFLEEIHFAEWNTHQDAGRPFKEGVEELSKQFPQYAELIQAYDIYWMDSITETIHETIQIAKNLKKAGWPLYLLSNFSVEKFVLMKEQHDFLEIFDDMIISGEHNIIKPDPAIFEIALKRINRKAGECLFIDDTLSNIETARKMGFITIQYQSPAQLKRDLYQLSIKGY
ncbi:MAG: HAD family phosphatase [Anaerolineales bacterium]|nr:HAD family phosphatase [Anaerolineales bacterium]